MLFSSIFFIFYFLPVVLAVYFAIPKRFISARNIVLLVTSLIFYSWGEPVYVFLMIYSIVFNYYMAIHIKKEQEGGGTGRKSLAFSLVVNLFILGFFKYFGFLMDTINHIFNSNIKYTALALPIGISFYTFQAISYLIDVYWKRVEPQKKLLDFGMYLSLFPQLIAGPIVRYRDVAEQLESRECSLEKFGDGAVRFILGLGKKVLLANNLGIIFSTVTSMGGDKMSVLSSWIGILAYTLQIYFDFSGYSDMAIGLGKMLGFTFNENFDHPYASKSITEFWRRWHMSLSSWFREYVYIPLGGNRVSAPRHIANLIIVWALTGLWHGASWNFVVWGLYYGILLILEKYVFGENLAKLNDRIRHTYTMIAVAIGWAFFSMSNLTAAGKYISTMLFAGGYPIANMQTAYLLRTNIILLVISVAACGTMPIKTFDMVSRNRKGLGLASVMLVFILSVSQLVFGSYNPFLYFRF